jgi:hypothetical protein
MLMTKEYYADIKTKNQSDKRSGCLKGVVKNRGNLTTYRLHKVAIKK